MRARAIPEITLHDPPDPDAEAALLGPFLAAYRRRFGRAPELERDDHGLLLRFPAHDSRAHAGATGRIDVFGSHPAVRAHLTRLGFRWDTRGFLDGAPAPAGFAARVHALDHALGPRPRYYQSAASAMSKRTWLLGNLAGEVPFAIGTRAYYVALDLRARVRVPELPGERAARDYHFFGLQHDLTKHLLLMHLVPRSLLRDLGSVLAGGLRFWHRGPLVAAPLARFYENDLLAYCQQIWRDLPDPSDFAPTCLAPENLVQLWRAAHVRLAEAARGPRAWLLRDADTCAAFSIARRSAAPITGAL